MVQQHDLLYDFLKNRDGRIANRIIIVIRVVLDTAVIALFLLAVLFIGHRHRLILKKG